MKAFTIPRRCCGCTILDDTFNRADSSILGDDWNEVSGNWEIVSNKLQIASTDAIVINDNICPSQFVERVAYDNVRFGATGDIVRLIIAWTDNNNYVYAQITAGTNAHTIVQRSGGIDTTLVTTSPRTINALSNQDMEICVRNGRVSVGAGTNVVMVSIGTSIVATEYAGLGTGATLTAALTCDQITMTYIRGAATDIPLCANCVTCDWVTSACSSTVVDEYDITVPTGFTAGVDVNCTDANFSGTFTLYHKPRSYGCRWVYDFTAGGSAYHYELQQTSCETQVVELLVNDSDTTDLQANPGLRLVGWTNNSITDRNGPNTLTNSFSSGDCSAVPATITVEAT